MAALLEVVMGGCTLVALAGLIWNIANVIECWRYLRRRRQRLAPWFMVRVRIRRT